MPGQNHSIRCVVHNTFWFLPFGSIRKYLLSHPAEIICLQEVPSDYRVHQLHKLLGFEYRVSAKENDYLKLRMSRNVTFSRYPITHEGSFNFNHKCEQIGGKAVPVKSAILWTVIEHPQTNFKVYNCHLQVRGIGIAERQQIMEFVLADARKHKGPVLVCGDFNTVMKHGRVSGKIIPFWHQVPKASRLKAVSRATESQQFTEYLRRYKFTDVLSLSESTWSIPVLHYELFHLKLDWMLVKNFRHYSYRLGPYIGDHRPIYSTLTF